jgi:hypothetical protein
MAVHCSLAEDSKEHNHQGDESTNEDSGDTAPHTKGDTGNNWEWNMVHGANATGKTNNPTANKEAKETNGNGLASSEADSHDR